ncbi:MAG: hypothetical protein LBQ31_01130 [Bacteroidales bacterium]|jgi:hypothetical protein|nr:hypothetical protein [Bacteroidales bacterium]
MKIISCLIAAMAFCFSYSQPQYESVFTENDSIDENNVIYKLNTVFIYDYEIIKNGERLKLKTNSIRLLDTSSFMGFSDSSFMRSLDASSFGLFFEYVNADSGSIGVDKILLLVKAPSFYDGRTHGNQTQISFLQIPELSGTSLTGAVENSENVWLHPIRDGYFSALQSCPFPYIKQPYIVGSIWADSMLIGYGSSPHTGEWEGQALLNYLYKIIDKKNVETKLGDLSCFIVESKAKSNSFETQLISYFSDKYGFVRLEYTLINGIKINFWIDKVVKI